VSDVTGF